MSELLSNALELGPLAHGAIRSLEEARCAADEALREGLMGKYPAAAVVLDMHVARLTAELTARAKQIGVACMKHDLIHALSCGYCLHEHHQAIVDFLRIWDDDSQANNSAGLRVIERFRALTRET